MYVQEKDREVKGAFAVLVSKESGMQIKVVLVWKLF